MGIPIPNTVTGKHVLAEINRRGLASVMNNTKWGELVHAVTTELPFRPAFQLKLLQMDRPIPPDFSDDDPWYTGDWTGDALWPYVEIEWMRILPRILRGRGMLLSPAIESVESQLLEILNRCHIPFRRDDKTFWIDGYVSPAR